MENASEALIMAFAVLIFVLALSIGISSFSLARQTSQMIIESTDKTYDYTYVSIGDTTREVGAETIVPTLYRAYKENYIVRFYNSDGTTPLDVYERKVYGQFKKTNEINLEQEAIGNQDKATLFINGILDNKNFQNNFPNSRNLHNNGFYDTIKKKKFKEELGIYYIEDKIEDINNPEEQKSEGVSDINKTEKRVITYTEI